MTCLFQATVYVLQKLSTLWLKWSSLSKRKERMSDSAFTQLQVQSNINFSLSLPSIVQICVVNSSSFITWYIVQTLHLQSDIKI